MTQSQRTNLVIGLLFIILGGYFLAVRFIPSLDNWIGARFDWPMIIIGVGLLLLVLGVLSGAPGFAIPAAIVGGIGGILSYQNATGDWASWSYMWALIPGFVGVGTILHGLMSVDNRRGIREGVRLIVISLIMFVIFGSFFGALESGFVRYWPALLIVYGAYLLIGMITRRDQPAVISSPSEPAPSEPAPSEADLNEEVQ
jgi:hypothetical protein